MSIFSSAGRWISAFILLFTITGCAGYKEGGSRTVGEFTDDVGIQMSVKTALIRDPEVDGLFINVEVSRNVVSLYGRVPSEYARSKALEVAGRVRGVTEVVDGLSIVEP